MAKKNEAPKKAAQKKVEPIELTKAALLAAAKDINKADIADPPIDVKGSESQLKKALLAASEIVEPEDELKPETFAALKAIAEEDPEDEDEDSEEGADEDEGDGADADETEAEIPDEDALEDLTVEELQNKCKAAGIPFKAKKTTKAQLIELLEAYEAEQEENASEEDEPEPEAKPEKKATPSKPAAPAKAEKKDKKDIFTKPSASMKVIMLVCENQEITQDQIREELTKCGLNCSNSTIQVYRSMTLQIAAVLKMYIK